MNVRHKTEVRVRLPYSLPSTFTPRHIWCSPQPRVGSGVDRFFPQNPRKLRLREPKSCAEGHKRSRNETDSQASDLE